jgi:type VI secretion system ImpC/EvpB family protein
MPLSALPFGQEAVFAGVRTLHAPARFTGPNEAVANANARFSSQLNSMLCVSRFAHYIKLLGREAVGSFRSADEIERRLHDWLQTYVNSNLSSTGETRARFPLVAARVAVREKPGHPGSFTCTVQLQPHFQLDDVAATFRLVTDIAAPEK